MNDQILAQHVQFLSVSSNTMFWGPGLGDLV